MDYMVHGVTKCQTRLRDFHFTSRLHTVKRPVLVKWASRGSVGKDLPTSAGASGDVGLIPGSGRSPGVGTSNPFLPGKSRGRRSLLVHSPCVHRVRHDRACTYSYKVKIIFDTFIRLKCAYFY